jgi:hypothetical protein
MIARTRNGAGAFTFSRGGEMSAPDWRHRLGIVAAFAPLAWLVVGCFLGSAEPRGLLLRVSVRD